MRAISAHHTATRVGNSRLPAVLAGLFAALCAAPSMSVEINQRPLTLASEVPGNMTLVPSVEFPTLLGPANFDMVNGVDTYNPNREYVGYFDPGKCYEYKYSVVESKRHFAPKSYTQTRACSGKDKEWSGNFMNWALTQSIDPFRKALTGGYRVSDEPTETWLEKAVNDDNSSTEWTPNKAWSAATTPSVMASANSYPVLMRSYKLRAQAFFTRSGAGVGDPTARLAGTTLETATPYNPETHDLSGANGAAVDTRVYAISIRVAVCVNDGAIRPEENCVRYPSGHYKPEGLIQKYQDKFRYSAFSYLNDTWQRNGGVLRAQQKYVGPYTHDPLMKPKKNDRPEWNSHDGTLIKNPDSKDADATNTRIGTNVVTNSGVINYINKFGQTTQFPSKSGDTIAELYYAMLRYFKNQGNVKEYTEIAAASAEKLTDKFPVITEWDNPIQYSCQKNVAITIGDVYTSADRALPGNTRWDIESSRAPEVLADKTVNVETALAKVLQLDGNRKYTPTSNWHGNPATSALIAGLAYDANTVDLQPTPQMPGKQTIKTFMVDVARNRKVEPRIDNQYYLAAKYGGFDVPENYQPYQNTAPLPEAWWTDGDVVGTAQMQNEKRPRNYFVASESGQMVSGLTRIFESASTDRTGAASAVATNGQNVQAGAVVYAPTYFTDWHGDLTASRLDPITRKFVAAWTAGANVPAPSARKIYANSGGYRQFKWDLLAGDDRAALSSLPFANANGEDVLNYLRGERSKEVRNGGSLRNRGGVLGDFVNSTPLYVGKPGAAFYANAGFSGGGQAYRDFAAANAGRRAVIYVGGNDGMLHGFDAETGAETYAFVPQAILKRSGMEGLAGYASPRYQHRFFVDGDLTVADVFVQNQWKTVLVGTLGRGGRGVFALDITDPNDVKFLWERYDAQIPGLGNNLGKPWVAQTADGVWKVLLGNGPNSDSGNARLLVLDVASGAVDDIDTGVGGDNGLSAVRAWDSNNDGFVDSAYGGDLKGNLWKFSGFGGSGTATRLFSASAGGTAQPITATPLVGRKPDSLETWVFFGTGAFLGGPDLTDKSVQSWYGIVDTGATVSRSELVERRIEYEGDVAQPDGSKLAVRVVSASKDGDMAGKKGWFMDLVSPGASGPAARGERMVVPNLFDGSRLLGISRIPDFKDPCNPGGDGFIMEIDPFTGARTSGHVFDTNGDGRIDGGDIVPPGVPASGIGSKGGSPNAGVIIPGQDGNVIPIQNDSGGLQNPQSAPFGLGAKRVAWREVRRD